jgi:hypothetical protein
MIKLDENYTIEPDTYAWRLLKTFEREVEVTEKTKNGGRRKTGKTEPKEVTETVYFPTIGACIRDYIEQVVKPQNSVQGILDKLSSIEQIISALPKIYVTNGKLNQVT